MTDTLMARINQGFDWWQIQMLRPSALGWIVASIGTLLIIRAAWKTSALIQENRS